MASSTSDEYTGEELVRKAVITQEDLDKAKQREEESGTPWYRQLLQMKKINFGVLDDYLRYEIHPKSKQEQNRELGQALLAMSAITESQLKEAMAEHKRYGRLLGSIILERGFANPEAIAMATARLYGLEYSSLEQTPSQRSALESVAESVAKKYNLLPIRLEGDKLTVLIAHPEDTEILKDAAVILARRIQPMLTNTEDIRGEISQRYKGQSVVDDGQKPRAQEQVRLKREVKKITPIPSQTVTKEKEPQAMATEEEAEVEYDESEGTRFDEIARAAQGAPVITLVSTIIEGAVNSGATDIHMDPQEPEMRVRYRIDSILHDVMSIPEEIETAVVSRIKIMADMDITETRRPQDGHIGMEIGDDEFDVRVSTLPTFLGERVVLRLLDQSSVLAGIKDLGLEAEDERKLQRIVDQPYGMILVTGPTGSGKTTTLYAALNQKDVMTESIVTLEDPVEYQLSGINQVQIDPDIDMTFASTLRASLRQDIDVLLVGEIRDAETARIAIRAAMTGHLVFSTLHTNDAPEAISTLRNMGIPSYLIASALTAIIGQRLVRCICDNCKTSYAAQKALVKSLGLPDSTKRLYKGKGCELCYHTGTKGRTGIFEILEVTSDVRKLIAEDVSPERIAKVAKLKSMSGRCQAKVKKGIIPAEEFLRVIRQ